MRNTNVKLTPNTLLNRAKRKLGIKTFILPLSDEELLDILYEDTMPTFNRFYPRSAILKLDLNSLEPAEYATASLPQVSYGRRAYHIDITQYGSDLEIIDIEDVQSVNSDLSDYRVYNVGFQNGYDLFMDAFANASLMAMLSTPIIFYYQAPDILVLDEPGIINRNIVSVTFLLNHASDLSTIKNTYYDKLNALFMLDLQITLFACMKHMDKIDTTFGQIDLKIDSWENAEDKRKELETEWESNFISHRQKKVYRK